MGIQKRLVGTGRRLSLSLEKRLEKAGPPRPWCPSSLKTTGTWLGLWAVPLQQEVLLLDLSVISGRPSPIYRIIFYDAALPTPLAPGRRRTAMPKDFGYMVALTLTTTSSTDWFLHAASEEVPLACLTEFLTAFVPAGSLTIFWPLFSRP